MMQGEFTGKKMAMVMVGGFGVVIAVNLTMASYATSGFSGTVVDNSYVASQQFNGWLDAANAQEALGWDAALSRQDGALLISADNVPRGAIVSADIRRPLGQPDTRSLIFNPSGNGGYISQQKLPEGRWIVRLTITANGHEWRQEDSI
jgi:nitrogen fixation protein FixH